MVVSAIRRFAALLGTGAIIYASWLLILLTIPYLSFEKHTDFLVTKQLVYHIDYWRISFYVHIFSSPLVILTGLFQFNRWLIHRKPAVHRLLGKVYIAVVLFISGPAALIMSFYANGNLATKASFILLSFCWIVFTWLGYRKIRLGQTGQHARFMLWSYALTLSAVTLRFYAYLLDVSGTNISPITAYLLIAWGSWIPNLLLAELLYRGGFTRRLLKP